MKIIIIGSAAAGINAAKAARKTNEQCEITVVTKDTETPYYRPYLTEYIGDKDIENKSNFYLNPKDWYSENNITLKLGTEIKTIDRKHKKIIDISGTGYEYDKLILTTGANPFVPIKNALEKNFVFTVRSLEDAKIVEQFSSGIKKAAVIGGGLLGLEAAWALSQQGLEVTVIELEDRLLPIQLDEEGSSFLLNVMTLKGIKTVTSAITESIEKNGIIKLKDKRELQTDMVLVSIGVRADITLAKEAGLETDRGIVVNEKMKTTDPDIYAGGDAAQFGHLVPMWIPAVKQGTVAGTNAAGGNAVFKDESLPAVLNAFGIRFISVGTISGKDVYTYSKNDEKSYRKLFFKNGKTIGGILINDPAKTMKILDAVKKGEKEQAARDIF